MSENISPCTCGKLNICPVDCRFRPTANPHDPPVQTVDAEVTTARIIVDTFRDGENTAARRAHLTEAIQAELAAAERRGREEGQQEIDRLVKLATAYENRAVKAEREADKEAVIAHEGEGIRPEEVLDGYTYTAEVVREKIKRLQAERATTEAEAFTEEDIMEAANMALADGNDHYAQRMVAAYRELKGRVK
jgi:hypothetical protein